ncbi:MAG: bifunctional folylpolyglutamate synthase/dihydrofolate synthase [Candidatus Omnitrophica bacterium]|nr:bifunctional folylpolyglutamate synthase/dihydrofolate synthase [Candidatus Omnitrophota bacterium]
MTYEEISRYLDSFVNYEKFISFDYKESLKLERMKKIAAMLGDPHRGLRCIHIAGTKGKGSTAAMVASILREAGFKVGLYTSPHLISFRERIRINNELISEADLCNLGSRIKSIFDKIDRGSEVYPTFFEVYTALAFLYFKEKKVDFCVVEVGLGGRLDATNIIMPLCCGITHISFEHTKKLGNTLSEIATEKSGIIKENSICVSSLQESSVRDVIRKTCAERKCKLYEVGRDLYFKEETPQIFSVTGVFQKYPCLEVGLLGEHQFMNATTAIGLIESLRFYDIIINEKAIRDGLKNVHWPGRLQIIQHNPYIVLDGAQNSSSAKVLKEAIKKFFHYDRLILVLGISKDKDIKGICDELGPISDEIILTKANLPRAEEPSVIKTYLQKEPQVTSSVEEAMYVAQELAAPADLILVTGSLFVVGEVLGKIPSEQFPREQLSYVKDKSR